MCDVWYKTTVVKEQSRK